MQRSKPAVLLFWRGGVGGGGGAHELDLELCLASTIINKQTFRFELGVHVYPPGYGPAVLPRFPLVTNLLDDSLDSFL